MAYVWLKYFGFLKCGRVGDVLFLFLGMLRQAQHKIQKQNSRKGNRQRTKRFDYAQRPGCGRS